MWIAVDIVAGVGATRVSGAARMWMKRRIVADPHWARSMHWLIDGYNLIRRDPALASREAESLEAGRVALCRLLGQAARGSGDRFTVVFDGRGEGGRGTGVASVSVVFSSARETADRVLARLAVGGGAVVSNDREVRHAATRAGAIAVTADEFLGRMRAGAAGGPSSGGDNPTPQAPPYKKDEDEEPEHRGPRKGNPRRLPRKARDAARALRRLNNYNT
jgi:predicted RNA-binding protein with PIN domain